MNCILLSEYDVYTYDLHLQVENKHTYQKYGPSASMLGPGGFHPNRCVYIIPSTDLLFSWLTLKGIGQHHYFDRGVLEKNGWI